MHWKLRNNFTSRHILYAKHQQMMERLGSNNKQQTTNNKQQTTNNKQHQQQRCTKILAKNTHIIRFGLVCVFPIVCDKTCENKLYLYLYFVHSTTQN
jgi:hypothetical protein